MFSQLVSRPTDLRHKVKCFYFYHQHCSCHHPIIWHRCLLLGKYTGQDTVKKWKGTSSIRHNWDSIREEKTHSYCQISNVGCSVHK